MYPEVVFECSVEWCPSVVCADSRRVYPEVVSECSVVWRPSVGCTDLRAQSVCVRVSRAESLVNAGLDLMPDGACISFIRVSASPR